MAEDFASKCLKSSVAQLCLPLGWHNANVSAIEVSNDIVKRYIQKVGALASKFSELGGRDEGNLDDLALSFDLLGVRVPDLEEYVTNVEMPRFPHKMYGFPAHQPCSHVFERTSSRAKRGKRAKSGNDGGGGGGGEVNAATEAESDSDSDDDPVLPHLPPLPGKDAYQNDDDDGDSEPHLSDAEGGGDVEPRDSEVLCLGQAGLPRFIHKRLRSGSLEDEDTVDGLAIKSPSGSLRSPPASSKSPVLEHKSLPVGVAGSSLTAAELHPPQQWQPSGQGETAGSGSEDLPHAKRIRSEKNPSNKGLPVPGHHPAHSSTSGKPRKERGEASSSKGASSSSSKIKMPKITIKLPKLKVAATSKADAVRNSNSNSAVPSSLLSPEGGTGSIDLCRPKLQASVKVSESRQSSQPKSSSSLTLSSSFRSGLATTTGESSSASSQSLQVSQQGSRDSNPDKSAEEPLIDVETDEPPVVAESGEDFDRHDNHNSQHAYIEAEMESDRKMSSTMRDPDDSSQLNRSKVASSSFSTGASAAKTSRSRCDESLAGDNTSSAHDGRGTGDYHQSKDGGSNDDDNDNDGDDDDDGDGSCLSEIIDIGVDSPAVAGMLNLSDSDTSYESVAPADEESQSRLLDVVDEAESRPKEGDTGEDADDGDKRDLQPLPPVNASDSLQLESEDARSSFAEPFDSHQREEEERGGLPLRRLQTKDVLFSLSMSSSEDGSGSECFTSGTNTPNAHSNATSPVRQPASLELSREASKMSTDQGSLLSSPSSSLSLHEVSSTPALTSDSASMTDVRPKAAPTSLPISLIGADPTQQPRGVGESAAGKCDDDVGKDSDSDGEYTGRPIFTPTPGLVVKSLGVVDQLPASGLIIKISKKGLKVPPKKRAHKRHRSSKSGKSSSSAAKRQKLNKDNEEHGFQQPVPVNDVSPVSVDKGGGVVTPPTTGGGGSTAAVSPTPSAPGLLVTRTAVSTVTSSKILFQGQGKKSTSGKRKESPKLSTKAHSSPKSSSAFTSPSKEGGLKTSKAPSSKGSVAISNDSKRSPKPAPIVEPPALFSEPVSIKMKIKSEKKKDKRPKEVPLQKKKSKSKSPASLTISSGKVKQISSLATTSAKMAATTHSSPGLMVTSSALVHQKPLSSDRKRKQEKHTSPLSSKKLATKKASRKTANDVVKKGFARAIDSDDSSDSSSDSDGGLPDARSSRASSVTPSLTTSTSGLTIQSSTLPAPQSAVPAASSSVTTPPLVYYCPVCKQPDDGRPMVACDGCNDDRWYHWVCVGMAMPPKESDTWFCPDCAASKKPSSRPSSSAKKKKKPAR